MALIAGTRLGPYEIHSALGAGGMGEVYRATDTRLNRDVAIKVLPASFAADADRLRRFTLEAQAAGALNHPAVLAIYDIGDHDGSPYLVSELLEGESLRARIDTARIPVSKAIDYARQIASGLAAAHARGITHRDIKPDNLFVTADGHVKILDFGLAKLDPRADAGASGATTRFRELTEAGTVLGTVGYMSPEQVRGQPADARADIFSLGVVLYEMLASRRPFQAESSVETMNAILKEDPPELTGGAWQIPGAVEQVVRHCLEKNPDERFQSARDLAFALQSLSSASSPAQSIAAIRRPARLPIAGAAAMLVAAVAGGAYWAGRRWGDVSTVPQVTRFDIPFPRGHVLEDSVFSELAIAPDGRTIAYTAHDGQALRIYVRTIDQTAVHPLAGTDGGREPFFSPDGRWLGFFGDGQLKKVSLADGTVVQICGASDLTGAAWAADGTIVFAPGFAGGLFRVSAEGGEPQPYTRLDAGRNEASHGWPALLPGGDHVLYTIEYTGRPFDEASIAVVPLKTTGKPKVVLRGGTSARYVPGGHIVFGRGSRLLAAPFDLDRLEVTGDTTTVVEGVSAEIGRGRINFAVSQTGSLAYIPGALNDYPATLSWVDRTGTATPVTDTRRGFSNVSLSPDDGKILMDIVASDDDIWSYDVERGILRRMTFGFENQSATWSPDGRRFTFASARDGVFNLYLGSTDGEGAQQRLTTSTNAQSPGSWSVDGKHLVFVENDPSTRGDLWTLLLDGDRRPRAIVKSPFDEQSPALSPDGRWLAYTSDETERVEVYVEAFPGAGQKHQISNEGASIVRPSTTALRWSRDGRELFYWSESRLMSVPVSLGGAFDSGRPRLVFDKPGVTSFDVARDGRFLISEPRPQPPGDRIIVVLHWTDELKRSAR